MTEKPSPPASSSNTLRKVGADLRWLMQKSGVDPERSSPEHPAGAVVSIAVNTTVDQSLLISTILREFDADVMHREDQNPHCVRVFGVWLCVLVKETKQKKEAA